jgi:hypothetical protein
MSRTGQELTEEDPGPSVLCAPEAASCDAVGRVARRLSTESPVASTAYYLVVRFLVSRDRLDVVGHQDLKRPIRKIQDFFNTEMR